MTGALQAIVFDFDGVIANSEPLHLRAFQQTLADRQLALTPADYYSRYLGYDDVGVFRHVALDRGIALTDDDIGALVEQKGQYIQQLLSAGEVLFPGATDFIRQAAASVPVAIASGAQRHEIEEILEATGLDGHFAVIVAAGDTVRGKPAPDPYARAFQLLQRSTPSLAPDRCVAIEDSRWGLDSARDAGLRCVAVMNSYPAAELPGAELIVEGLNTLTLEMLDALVSNPAEAGLHGDSVGRVPRSGPGESVPRSGPGESVPRGGPGENVRA
jgi:HAD superfamily hydrolase (TIGR01509 family)